MIVTFFSFKYLLKFNNGLYLMISTSPKGYGRDEKGMEAHFYIHRLIVHRSLAVCINKHLYV